MGTQSREPHAGEAPDRDELTRPPGSGCEEPHQVPAQPNKGLVVETLSGLNVTSAQRAAVCEVQKAPEITCGLLGISHCCLIQSALEGDLQLWAHFPAPARQGQLPTQPVPTQGSSADTTVTGQALLPSDSVTQAAQQHPL
ncbi:hypothetical protein H8958_022665 [Nasalis larvatus]